ncbi:septum formation family protein [Nocardioides litoris]|uniref:septum formation family protein n=1 Tax=Nocardioides litoris TaxID=1926648 RepID=UPI001476ED65|nr:septum formation family protein [Nocardioides litoris]
MATTVLRRRVAAVAVVVGLVPSLGGCGLFGGDDGEEGVQSIEPGQCFQVPSEVKEQLADLDEVPCDEPHDREAFAVIGYEPPDDETDADVFPGDDTLTRYADGRCASAFGDYTGTPYLDSDLYFTYLLPSPRSWQSGDRDVVCFAFDPGRRLDRSVRDPDADAES